VSDTALRYSLRRWRCCLVVLVAFLLGGCSTVGYYYQSAKGQLDLMCRARDIDRVLGDESVAPSVRRRLEQVQAMRRFNAATALLICSSVAFSSRPSSSRIC